MNLASKKESGILSQAGFTLMEVLIAIVLLAFITIAIVTIQSDSRLAKERVVSEDRNMLQVETAFSRLDWDFSQIFSPLYYSHEMRMDQYAPEYEKAYIERTIGRYQQNQKFSMVSFDGQPIPTYEYPEKHTIVFFTTSNRRKLKDIKQSTYAWVKYALEKDEESGPDDDTEPKNKWVRYFVPDNPFSKEPIDWDDVKGQTLLRNIESIKYEFWSHERKKWVDNISLIKNGKHIIYALKVTMKWFNKDGFEEIFVRVFRPNFPKFSPENMYDFLKPKEYQNNQNPAAEDPYGEDPAEPDPEEDSDLGSEEWP